MKKISTALGIAIIILVAVILFGGVLGYEYYTKSATAISITLTANNSSKPISIKRGDSVKIAWTSKNTASCRIDSQPQDPSVNLTVNTPYEKSGSGYKTNLPSTGVLSVNPSSDITTYTVTCYGKGKQSSKSIIVNAFDQEGCDNLSGSQSITITSPKGGEQWTEGKAYNITWTSTGLAAETADIILGTAGNGTAIAQNIPVQNNSYSWTVPTDLQMAGEQTITVESCSTENTSNPINIVYPAFNNTWKTYTNAAYGFSFQYPNDPNYAYLTAADILPVDSSTACSAINGSSSIPVTSNDGALKISILCENIDAVLSQPICEGNGNECYGGWETVCPGEQPDCVKSQNEKAVATIGNKSGYQFTGGIPTTNDAGYADYVALGDKTLEISFIGDYNVDLPVFQKILASFTFTK